MADTDVIDVTTLQTVIMTTEDEEKPGDVQEALCEFKMLKEYKSHKPKVQPSAISYQPVSVANDTPC